MDKVIQEQEEVVQKVIAYSKWNKLTIHTAELKHKTIFNILKYGLALLITIFSLISLWFSAQWQTENVLKAIGIDISKYSNYIPSDDNTLNALVNGISKYKLWNLQNSLLTESGVQALVAIGLLSLASVVPLLIFKNGTAWSIGSIVLSMVLLIIVITLFSLGLVSQSNALKNNVIAIDGQAAIDLINKDIVFWKDKIIQGDNLTFDQIINNNKSQIEINVLNSQKNDLLVSFVPKLKEFLNKF